jgi:hypothetical protein
MITIESVWQSLFYCQRWAQVGFPSPNKKNNLNQQLQSDKLPMYTSSCNYHPPLTLDEIPLDYPAQTKGETKVEQ